MTKSELERARDARLLVKSCEDDLNDLRSIAYSAPTASYAAIVGSSPHSNESKPENYTIKIMEYEERVKKAMACYIEEQTKASQAIDKLENYKERLILRLRYINGKTIKEICSIVGYTRSRVYEIHDRAIENIATL